MLIEFSRQLETQFPTMASQNLHKPHVKLGGNVINGRAEIYDYLSFKGKKSIIAPISFMKIMPSDPLEILVTLTDFKRGASKEIKRVKYLESDFSSAKEKYIEFLQEAMT